jgi:hypothetical protein
VVVYWLEEEEEEGEVQVKLRAWETLILLLSDCGGAALHEGGEKEDREEAKLRTWESWILLLGECCGSLARRRSRGESLRSFDPPGSRYWAFEVQALALGRR